MMQDQAAVQVQRIARGMLRRRCKARLTSAVLLSQRRWRSQHQHVAVLQLQRAARLHLQASLEARLDLALSSTEAGIHYHTHSMMVLQTVKQEGVLLREAGEKAPQTVAGIVQSIVQGVSEKSSMRTRPQDEDAATLGGMVEHCGWLLKQGRVVQNWKMRWVMLQARGDRKLHQRRTAVIMTPCCRRAACGTSRTKLAGSSLAALPSQGTRCTARLPSGRVRSTSPQRSARACVLHARYIHLHVRLRVLAACTTAWT